MPQASELTPARFAPVAELPDDAVWRRVVALWAEAIEARHDHLALADVMLFLGCRLRPASEFAGLFADRRLFTPACPEVHRERLIASMFEVELWAELAGEAVVAEAAAAARAWASRYSPAELLGVWASADPVFTSGVLHRFIGDEWAFDVVDLELCPWRVRGQAEELLVRFVGEGRSVRSWVDDVAAPVAAAVRSKGGALTELDLVEWLGVPSGLVASVGEWAGLDVPPDFAVVGPVEQHDEFMARVLAEVCGEVGWRDGRGEVVEQAWLSTFLPGPVAEGLRAGGHRWRFVSQRAPLADAVGGWAETDAPDWVRDAMRRISAEAFEARSAGDGAAVSSPFVAFQSFDFWRSRVVAGIRMVFNRLGVPMYAGDVVAALGCSYVEADRLASRWTYRRDVPVAGAHSHRALLLAALVEVRLWARSEVEAAAAAAAIAHLTDGGVLFESEIPAGPHDDAFRSVWNRGSLATSAEVELLYLGWCEPAQRLRQREYLGRMLVMEPEARRRVAAPGGSIGEAAARAVELGESA